MRNLIKKHLGQVLNHLYINPLEKCNLHCKICYTRKTDPILKEAEISGFIEKYLSKHQLKSITFCGGEVFTLPYFIKLVNKLTRKGIFIQIITNGTIDSLDKLLRPNAINLIVSIDGLKDFHDKNRGKGNFDKSIKFLIKAQKSGFHTEIFSIVTKQNYFRIDQFEKTVKNLLGNNISITLHPRKPLSYLLHHPSANIFGEIEGFGFLDKKETVSLVKKRNTFPPKKLGCYQIALASNSKVFGCCEGTVPIGTINDDIEILFENLGKRLKKWEKTNYSKNCLGCSQPDFVCGLKDI